MPMVEESFRFVWAPPLTRPCNHGTPPRGTALHNEFFQKVRETRTTLDRIHLSSLARRPAERPLRLDYDKWALNGGKRTGALFKKDMSDTYTPEAPTYFLRHEGQAQSWGGLGVRRDPGVARVGSQSTGVRPLGIDNDKIEAALQYGLCDKELRGPPHDINPHPMDRVQPYDLVSDYGTMIEEVGRLVGVGKQGVVDYSPDSAKVWRVMQEEMREQTTRRLMKGRCGGSTSKWQSGNISFHQSTTLPGNIPLYDGGKFDIAASPRTSSGGLLGRETASEGNDSTGYPGSISKNTPRHKMDFSAYVNGVVKSNTVTCRLPRLDRTTRSHKKKVDRESVTFPPLHDDRKHVGARNFRKKRKGLGKRISKEQAADQLSTDDEIISCSCDNNATRNEDGGVMQMELKLSKTLMEVSNKLSLISGGGGGDTAIPTAKSTSPKHPCRTLPTEPDADQENLTENHTEVLPLTKTCLETDCESDDQCLCNVCLKPLPSRSSTPSNMQTNSAPKSILSPRQSISSSSGRSGKSVTFAEMDRLEDVRAITPLAERNENMKRIELEEKRIELEEKREILNDRDMMRRERKKREFQRLATNRNREANLDNGEGASKTQYPIAHLDKSEQQIERHSTQRATEVDAPREESDRDQQENRPEMTTNREILDDESSNQHSNCTQLITITNRDTSDESSSQRNAKCVESTHQITSEDSEDTASGSSEPGREEQVLLRDPRENRSFNKDTISENDRPSRKSKKMTVAQLSYRVKSIFERAPSPTIAAKAPPPNVEVESKVEMVSEEDNDDDSDVVDRRDDPFVTKCVSWNETTSDVPTPGAPVEGEDLTDFILSMRDCRYIRWGKSYKDIMEKLEQ